MDLLQTLKIRLTLWNLHRRAAPRRGFERALLARIEGRPAGVFSFQMFALQRLAVPLGVLVLSLVATSTYAYTSPNVAAGHPLYRFKRKFEGYQEQLSRSPESRAKFYVQKAERRLAEAAELADTSTPASTAFINDGLDELTRSMQVIRTIPDAARRRQAVKIFVKGDGSYLVRVQEMVAERPEQMRPAAREAITTDRERLRAEVQSFQDPELRAILRANLLAREAMLNSFLAEDPAAATLSQ